MELIEKLKGLRMKRILQAYNIVEETDLNGSKTFLFKAAITSNESQVVIPSRKSLVKRAKSVIFQSVNDCQNESRHFVIDKNDVRNVYIFELLHAFTKLARHRGEEGLKLLQYAVFDAETRKEDDVMKAVSETLRDIINHISCLPESKVDMIRSMLAISVPLNDTKRRTFFSLPPDALKPVDVNKSNSNRNAMSKPSSTVPIQKPDSIVSAVRESTVKNQYLSAACDVLNHLIKAFTTTPEAAIQKAPSALRLSYSDLLLLGIVSSRGVPLHSPYTREMKKSKFTLTWSSVALVWSSAFEKSGYDSHSGLLKGEINTSVWIEKKVLEIVRSMLDLIEPSTPPVKWLYSQLTDRSNELRSSHLDAKLDGEPIKFIEVEAIDCYAVINQIMQQTLLRHIVLTYDDELIRKTLENSYKPPIEWIIGWSFEDDLALMNDILFFGYSHFRRVLRGIEERKMSAASTSCELNCVDVQKRINWITNTLFDDINPVRFPMSSASVIDISQGSFNLSLEVIDLSMEENT
jgi:hypothetical protein